MEKLVLSKGAEYRLVTDGVNEYNGVLNLKVRPMEGVTKTAEEVLADFTGNDTITAKIDDTAIRIFTNFTKVKDVRIVPNFVVNTKYVCPECNEAVESTATTCAKCNATFDAPKMAEETDTIFVLNVTTPDVNDRLNDVENAITEIGASLLAMGGDDTDSTDGNDTASESNVVVD